MFIDGWEEPLTCVGVKELGPLILLSGDIFSGDEAGVSWFVTLTVI